jgi:transcriptional regulator of aroF, aroG, tyrA and aromatic amino acid transport
MHGWLEGLVQHFLDQASRQIGCPMPRLAPAAMDKLSQYHWPGNVRQLENVLFQAVSLCEGGVVKSEHIRLPDYGARQPLGEFSLDGDLAQIVGRFEKAVLESLMSEYSAGRWAKDWVFHIRRLPTSCVIIHLTSRQIESEL